MKKIDKFTVIISIMIFLTIAGIVIDALDMFFYYKFLNNKGISIWSTVQFSVIKEYLTTFPGNILTVFAIVPWVLISIYLNVEQYKDKICFWKK